MEQKDLNIAQTPILAQEIAPMRVFVSLRGLFRWKVVSSLLISKSKFHQTPPLATVMRDIMDLFVNYQLLIVIETPTKLQYLSLIVTEMGGRLEGSQLPIFLVEQ
jgi:hypothetical protein